MKIFSLRNFLTVCALATLGFIAVQVNDIHHQLRVANKHPRKFTVDQITNQMPYNPEWNVKTSPELLRYANILTSQPYNWLGKGCQCCAFLSEDGQYVLKFVYTKRLTEKNLLEQKIQESINSQDKSNFVPKDRNIIFTSTKLAFEEFPEESGIIFVHLNNTENCFRAMRIFDQKNECYRIKLDSMCFIIQRKAEYILPTLTKLMTSGKQEEAQARISQLFNLLYSMAKKGFIDTDHDLIRNNNIGFTKDRAIYIDTGRISKKENANLLELMKREFSTRLPPLYDWLQFTYPELVPYWDQQKEAILSSINKDEIVNCTQK